MSWGPEDEAFWKLAEEVAERVPFSQVEVADVFNHMRIVLSERPHPVVEWVSGAPVVLTFGDNIGYRHSTNVVLPTGETGDKVVFSFTLDVVS